MARSLWNGCLSLRALHVPVKLYTATEPKSIAFRERHLADGSPIEHRRIDPRTGEEVPYEDIVKGYEIKRGRWVVLAKEEIASAAGKGDKVLELSHFVPGDQIDPVFYDSAYYLEPREGGEKAYRLIAEALGKSGRVGVGRFVLRTRERLVALRPKDGTLVLQTMRFHDELVPAGELDLPRPKKAPTKQEVQMAGALISSLEAAWKPEKFEDAHRKSLLGLIRGKSQGKAIEPAKAEPREHEVPDLMAALQASLGRKPAAPKKAKA